MRLIFAIYSFYYTNFGIYKILESHSINNPWDETQAQHTKSARQLVSVWEENPDLSTQNRLWEGNLHALRLDSTRQKTCPSTLAKTHTPKEAHLAFSMIQRMLAI